MFAKITPSMFIDALQLELTAQSRNPLKGILRDDKGSVCRVIEKSISNDRERFMWTGLSDLPYGKYTVELSQGDDEMKMNLVKRV
ncbi:MAG: hypothetical protein WDN26_17950 [Chitinophagaceae bacterium]